MLCIVRIHYKGYLFHTVGYLVRQAVKSQGKAVMLQNKNLSPMDTKKCNSASPHFPLIIITWWESSEDLLSMPGLFWYHLNFFFFPSPGSVLEQKTSHWKNKKCLQFLLPGTVASFSTRLQSKKEKQDKTKKKDFGSSGLCAKSLPLPYQCEHIPSEMVSAFISRLFWGKYLYYSLPSVKEWNHLPMTTIATYNI